MQNRSRSARFAVAFACLCLALVALGCPSTLRFRAVQSDFIDVVRTDNEATVDPLAAPLTKSAARSAYSAIAKDLSESEINDLDEVLRGNAWMIRAYSEWRSGAYPEAMASARKGSKSKDVQPRDRVLLKLIDALAQDSAARDEWVEAGSQLPDFAAYEPYDERFRLTFEALQDTAREMDANTPDDTRYYVAYQRWRILRNWGVVITSVDREAAVSEERDRARALARETLPSGPKAEADAARDSIPDGHPLRQLITAQGG